MTNHTCLVCTEGILLEEELSIAKLWLCDMQLQYCLNQCATTGFTMTWPLRARPGTSLILIFGIRALLAKWDLQQKASPASLKDLSLLWCEPLQQKASDFWHRIWDLCGVSVLLPGGSGTLMPCTNASCCILTHSCHGSESMSSFHLRIL